VSEVVWKPYGDYIEKSNITRFMRKHGIKDYEELVRRSCDELEWFWDAIMEDLDIRWYKPYERVLDDSGGIPWCKWYVGGKTNIVYNCLDKHMTTHVKDKLAFIWEGDDGAVRRYTYKDVYREVCKMANALKNLKVEKGDTVGIYMPMSPQIIFSLLACLKIGALAIPIFSGFGPAPVSARLRDAEAKVLITADASMRRGKIFPIKENADEAVDMVPSIKHVVVYRRAGIDIPWHATRDIWMHQLVQGLPEECPTEEMDSEDYAIMIYTSGTTGKPKGAVHTHGGCLAQICKELGYYFDVKEDDVFFWLTDIGWMMGPWMIIGVMSFGGTFVIFEGVPDYPEPDRLWELVDRHAITTFGISPTAIRMLMRFGEEWMDKHDISSLRLLGSTGEPWDTESWMWFFEKVGKKKLPIINISGGTEIVGCFLSPLPITDLKPITLRGPGLGMAIDVYDEDGKPVRGEKGHLVATKPAPSMTRGFWKDPERYLETYWSRWPDIWYHGDWASVDEDGFWFLHGRSDDTIKVSGRRTGPAEIEAALIEHEAVSEAAVIGVHHDIKGEAVVCFVVLRNEFQPSSDLNESIKDKVAEILGKVGRPDEVHFVNALPKTRSAKIVRRLIKAKYLGEELGDLASLENPQALDEIPVQGDR
jgi:acetyl-CoA synthetase